MNEPDPDVIFAPVAPLPDEIPLSAEPMDGPVLTRTPPHNFEAEASLLGAVLNNNAAYERISDFLLPEHFADSRHGRIFSACAKLIERGQVANPVTLKAYFKQDDELAEIGGEQYLADLSNNLVAVINVTDYAHIIYDAHVRRELITIGEDTVNDAYAHDLDVNATDMVDMAEQKLFNLATSGASEKGFISFGEGLKGAIAEIEASFHASGEIVGVDTGLRDLNRKLGGLHPSDLLILAGRPSMGKTALAMNVAYNAALAAEANRKAGEKKEISTGAVAVFSLEMSADQLAARLLSQAAMIASDNMRRGDLTDEDFDQIIVASQRISNIPMYIDDTPALPVSSLRTRCRRLKRQQGLSMIVVDYLQLLNPPVTFKGQGRVQEISAITMALKALAKELEVPVLALSQLSRAVEQRDDKRPQLSDLRESGSIEQDADVVMFIYREQYYLERAEPAQNPGEEQAKFDERYTQWKHRLDEVHNTAEVILAKQRHGPVGTVRLFFDGNFTKFGDLYRDFDDDYE